MNQNDYELIQKAIRSYKSHSRPTSCCGSDPVTVDDIRRVIDNTAKLIETISKIELH